jgi:hypothetical protein
MTVSRISGYLARCSLLRTKLIAIVWLEMGLRRTDCAYKASCGESLSTY